MNFVKIFIGSDHAGFESKERLKDFLIDKIAIEDLGCFINEACDYPDIAQKLVQKILENQAYGGILICGSGIGMSIAANRYNGIYGALCYNQEAAKLARLHNNANIIIFGEKMMGIREMKECSSIFIDQEFESGRHMLRINKINK